MSTIRCNHRPIMRSGALLYGLLLLLLICPSYAFADDYVHDPIFYGLKAPLDSGFSQLSTPGGIVRDSSGNLYIVDKGNSKILKLQPNGSSSELTITGLSTPLSSPTGIAVDGNNSIYVADTGNNRVVILTPTDATTASASVLDTTSFPLTHPEAVAVDSHGNVYIANSGSDMGEIVLVASGQAHPICGFFKHPHALAVDPAGNLYVAQDPQSDYPVQKITFAPFVITAPFDLLSTTVTSLAVDGTGNVYVGIQQGSSEGILEFPGGNAMTTPKLAESNSDLVLAGLAADNSGNLYVTSTAGARVFKLTAPAVDFGHVQLGSSTQTTYDLLFGIDTSVTVDTVMAYTEGVPNQDYKATTSFTCTAIGVLKTCSTRVGFLPSGPGVRRGALKFAYHLNSNNYTLSVPLTGVGDAPGAGFAVGKVSAVGLGTDLVLPIAMAFDGANNLFVTEMTATAGSKIQKVSAQDGSLSDVNLGGPQDNLMGLAFDTLGYFYFVGEFQSEGQRVEEIFGMDLASNTSPTPIPLYQTPVSLRTLSNPFGLVADRAGNLYVADTGHHRVLKATPQSPSLAPGQTRFTLSQLSTGNISVTPDTLAVDDSGTVYIADEGDSGTPQVVKVTPDGTATVISTGSYQLKGPTAVAVDRAGTLYITDADLTQFSAVIVKVTATGDVSLVDTGTYSLKRPAGLVFDRNGALYVADMGNPTATDPSNIGARILKIDFSSPRALTFADTNTGLPSNDSPQTVAVFNRGNQPLQFSADPALSNSADFQQGTTDSACVSGKVLLPGESCGVSLTFRPQTGGNLSTTVTLTNNHLNQAGSTQTITATGTGIHMAEATIAGPANQPVQFPIGQQAAVDITVTGESGSPVPTGTLSFNLRSSGGAPLSSGTVSLAAGTASATATLHVPSYLTPGNYTFTVLYSGDANYGATSTPVDIAVQLNRITPTINWAQPAAITYGTNLSGILNATATGAVLIDAARPTVPGRLAAHSLADSVVAGSFTYTASLGVNAVPVTGATVLSGGVYTLTASFTPSDTNIYTSASKSVSLTVDMITPTITLTMSANPVLVTNAVTFTARVASPTGNPTGFVQFYDGTTLLGMDNLTNGTAAFTTSSLAVATHSITAMYSGNSIFNSVTSTAVAEVVNDFTLNPGSGTGGNGSTAGSPGSIPTQTILAGGTATYTVIVGPTAGTTLSEPVTLTVSHDLPPGSTALLGLVGTGTTGTMLVIPGGQPMPGLQLVVHVAGDPSGAGPIGHNRLNPLKTIPFAFGFLLLPFGGRLRQAATGKRARRTGLLLVLSLLSLTALIGFSGCGAVNSGYLTEHHYTIKVTATSGTLSRYTTFNLVVR